MKYTEKIGDGFLTYEKKDLEKNGPSTFLDLILMFIGTIILSFILFGIFMLGCWLLGLILN
jgi:hypothetical protein